SLGFDDAIAALPGPKRLMEKLGDAVEGLARQAFWLSARPWANAARRDVLGLPPLPLGAFYRDLDKRHVPLLFGVSPSVHAPRELADWVHVTGYWFLDRFEWQPPADLLTFLETGPPPVFVGFGGLPDKHADDTAAAVIEALTRNGQRGILLQPSFPTLPPEAG